jgi:hypothetical protein
MSAVISENRAFFNQLKKYYGLYTGGFIAFVIALGIAEQMGMSRQWIGYWFLFSTIALYAAIGIMSRTVDAVNVGVPGLADQCHGISRPNTHPHDVPDRYAHLRERVRGVCTWDETVLQKGRSIAEKKRREDERRLLLDEFASDRDRAGGEQLRGLDAAQSAAFPA